jgi:DNA-binding CsgD family transcriptional regulator
MATSTIIDRDVEILRRYALGAAVPDIAARLHLGRGVVSTAVMTWARIHRPTAAQVVRAVDAGRILVLPSPVPPAVPEPVVVCATPICERPAPRASTFEILGLASTGLRAFEIAAEIGIAPGAVRMSLSRAYAKTGTRDPGNALAILVEQERDRRESHGELALTDRECAALRLVSRRIDVTSIAAHLGVTRSAIEARLRTARIKLDADSRDEAVQRAIESGAIPGPALAEAA